jgi:hypothetical protein
MRRGTIVVFLFVVAAGIVVGVSRFLQSQPPLEYTVAVNALAEDWLRDSINRFNDTQPVVNATQRVQFAIAVIDDLAIWQNTPNYSAANHPAAWIPSSAVSVAYSDRYQTSIPSLARTPLVWGGYTSRVTVASSSAGASFDWDAVQQAAAAESWAALDGSGSNWGFVNLAFTPPDMTMSGLGALFSAAASFHENPDLSGSPTRDNAFRDWLAPVIASVPNFQTLGGDAAAAVARGPATAAIALLPENLWLKNLRGLSDESGDSFVFSYPAYQFMLDFPLAAWGDETQITEIEQMAVEALGQWLSAEAQQGRLPQYGLRPAAAEPAETDALFSAALPYGILLEPAYGIIVQAPARSEASGLAQWFSQQR